MSTRMLTGAALLAALTFSASTTAQGCANAGDTFWKRDTLPVVPAGLTAVSVIPGLCENESAGIVFEMPANMPPQLVTQVVCPWGSAGGTNGNTGVVDVEVYDGVSFSGAVASMGNLVFSLSGSISSNMQVTSHGLNTLDTSTYGIVVGAAPPTGNPPVRRFAICFRSLINPNGACASGYSTNFFTDNSQAFPLGCNNVITPTGTSLLEIQGQGWRDAALATVTGIPLCPLYFSGIWAIRCCTQDAFPAQYTSFGSGCGSPAPFLANTALPRIGQTMQVTINNVPQVGLFNFGLLFTGTNNQFNGAIPLPAPLAGLGLPGCDLLVATDLLADLFTTSGTTAVWDLAVPNNIDFIGALLYQQAFVNAPGANAFGWLASDGGEIQFGN